MLSSQWEAVYLEQEVEGCMPDMTKSSLLEDEVSMTSYQRGYGSVRDRNYVAMGLCQI